MANHSLPQTTSTYSNFVTELSGRFNDLALWLDPATSTPTNVPTNSIRWNSALYKWQKFDGAIWNDLTTTYALTAATFSGNTTLGSATTNSTTINGYASIGGSAQSTTSLNIASSALTGTSQTGIKSAITATSASTTSVLALHVAAATAAATFTVSDFYNQYIANVTKGSGSTITRQYGIYLADQTNGVTNYGIYSDVSSNTNKWNLYINGTAVNYLNGSLGVGIDNPSYKAQLYTSSASDIELGTTNSAGTALFGIKSTGNAYLGSISAGKSLEFWSSNSLAATIDSNGNLGLGMVPTSTVKLDINLTSGANTMSLSTSTKTTASAGTTGSGIRLGWGSSTNGPTIRLVNGGSYNNAGLMFSTWSSGAESDKLLLSNTGSAVLYGDYTNNSDLVIDAANTVKLLLQSNISSGGSIVGTTTNHPLIIYTNNTEKLRVGEAGQIGIGGANYGSSGQVLTSSGSGSAPTWSSAGIGISNDTTTNSNHYLVFSTTSNGNITGAKVTTSKLYFNPSTGILSATIFNSLSDISYKENISKIIDPLLILSNIDGVSFDWKDGSGSSYGVIAQQIEKVLPYAVCTDINNTKTVNYNAIISVLIESIKELYTEIQKIKG